MVSNKILLILSLVLITSAKLERDDTVVGRKKSVYKSRELDDDQFHRLARLENADHFRDVLHEILIPRVVGTKGHKKVQEFIINSMKGLDWSVETDKFVENAPIMGKLQFTNIVASLNPKAERYLVLACHYDSKYMPDYEFLGATDSAVPCALLINMAYVLQDQLSQIKDQNLSLMFVFFDGEEAFDTWGPHDSIYGARHLAKKWQSEGKIDRIDMLVLLDLLGAPDPQFYSLYSNTEVWYNKLVNAENRLSSEGLLQKYTNSGVAHRRPNRYFHRRADSSAYIEDDHVPFLKLGVPVIHMIPVPFPSVWHTEDDNLSVVDFATTENLNRIIRLFTMQYLLSYKPHS